MPANGTCEQAPYAAATSPGSRRWSPSSREPGTAARARDITFVPMHARSKGHDLCSGDAAWVNGMNPPNGDGLVLHPNAAGEAAIARAVVKVLRQAGIG